MQIFTRKLKKLITKNQDLNNLNNKLYILSFCYNKKSKNLVTVLGRKEFYS